MYKKIIEHIVRQLVDSPHLVTVNQAEKDQKVVLEIKVDQKDRGKVIGKEGKTIKALRLLVSALSRAGQEVYVTIAE